VLSGYQIASGTTEIVASGSTDLATQIVGGELDVFGLAIGATVSTGSILVESGGSAIDFTILSGGLLLVSSGGYADPGTLSGGTAVVTVGGSDDSTQISGGTQFIYGTATNATVFVGSQVVESGGFASGTVVSGGLLIVEPGGTAINATISSGGTAELIGSNTADLVPLSGATLEMSSGAVTVGIGGASSEVLAGIMISGLQAGDAIDLTDIPFSAGAAAFVSGSGLVVSVGVNSYELGLDPATDLTGDQLRVSNDGTGHAEINVAAIPQNIEFVPTASNAYLSQVTPFLADSVTGKTLNLLLFWNVGNGSAYAPFQILQYDPTTHGFFDDTADMFAGPVVPSLANPRNVTVANFNGNGPGFIIAEQGHDASPWPGATDTLLLSNQSGQLFDASANLPQTLAYTHDVSSGVVDPSGDIGVFFNNIFSSPNTAPYYLIGNGDGTFANKSSSFLPAVLHTTFPAFTASALLDVNGDGLADLIIGPEDQLQGAARLYLNPGNGNFSSVTPIALPSSPLPAGHDLFSSTLHGASVLDIQPIHLSSPNYADLVVISTTGNYEGYAIQILINDGSGHFTDQTANRLAGAPSSQVYTGGNFLQWIVRSFVVDLNGDGASDIAVQGNNGPSEVFLNDGSGHFNLAYLAANPAIMAVATIEGTPTLIESDGTLVPFAPPPVVTDPISDQVWLAGQTVSLTMPSDMFADPGGQDLTYTAAGLNGAPLPNWLSFDDGTETFFGTVPSGAKPFAVTITATDSSGWLAEDSFNVLPLTVVSGGQTIIVSSGQWIDNLERRQRIRRLRRHRSGPDVNRIRRPIRDLERRHGHRQWHGDQLGHAVRQRRPQPDQYRERCERDWRRHCEDR
jgi:autotransporter passenger strand-loop-strand repeat protein